MDKRDMKAKPGSKIQADEALKDDKARLNDNYITLNAYITFDEAV